MNILRWLLLDWKDNSSNNTDGTMASSFAELNLFAKAFCSLPVAFYRHLQLNIHVTGDDRGGVKDDACAIIVLVMCHHASENGETPQPVLLEELVTTPVAQQAYDLWMARFAHLTPRQQDLMAKNTRLRQEEIAMLQRQEAVLAKAGVVVVPTSSAHNTGGGGDHDEVMDESEHVDASDHDDDDHHPANAAAAAAAAADEDDSDSEIDELDVMAAMRKRQRTVRKELLASSRSESGGGGGGGAQGRNAAGGTVAAAVRWADSQLAREQAIRQRAAAAEQAAHALGNNNSSNSSHFIRSRRGIRPMPLRNCNCAKTNGPRSWARIRWACSDITDIASCRRRARRTMIMAKLPLTCDNWKIPKPNKWKRPCTRRPKRFKRRKRPAKESLEQLIERLGGLEAMENYNSTASILPTCSTFHPLLFLTLLHRKTNYKDLVDSRFLHFVPYDPHFGRSLLGRSRVLDGIARTRRHCRVSHHSRFKLAPTELVRK
jgi:hypothetical protein